MCRGIVAKMKSIDDVVRCISANLRLKRSYVHAHQSALKNNIVDEIRTMRPELLIKQSHLHMDRHLPTQKIYLVP